MERVTASYHPDGHPGTTLAVEEFSFKDRATTRISGTIRLKLLF